MGSPWQVFVIVVVYLYFVTGYGQKWMEKRKQYELTGLINIYNIFQVLANLYIFVLVRLAYTSKSIFNHIPSSGLLLPSTSREFPILVHTHAEK